MAPPHKTTADSSVTYVIFETIKPEFRLEYEAWLQEINTRLTSAPGFIGVEVSHPKADSYEYAIIVRFSTLQYLREWQLGSQAQQLIEQGRKYITDVRTQYFEGLGLLFHADVTARPPYWKQVLVSIVAVYPLILIVGWLLSFVPQLQTMPHALQVLISSVFVSMLMVWPMLPLLTKGLSSWLKS